MVAEDMDGPLNPHDPEENLSPPEALRGLSRARRDLARAEAKADWAEKESDIRGKIISDDETLDVEKALGMLLK